MNLVVVRVQLFILVRVSVVSASPILEVFIFPQSGLNLLDELDVLDEILLLIILMLVVSEALSETLELILNSFQSRSLLVFLAI